MTPDEAVVILNEHKFHGCDDYEFHSAPPNFQCIQSKEEATHAICFCLSVPYAIRKAQELLREGLPGVEDESCQKF